MARPSWLGKENVELISIGEKTGNVGITRLQARRSLLDPIGYEILVEVANASDDPASFRLELDLDDDPIDVVPLNLAARRAHGRRSSRRPPPKAAGCAPRSIAPMPCSPTTPPGRSCPAARGQKVIAGHAGQPVPREGVRGDPARRPGSREGRQGPPQQDGAQAWAASAAVRQNEAADRRLPSQGSRTRCRRATILVIEPERSGALWELGETLHNPLVAKQDKDSPLMAAHPARQRADARGAEADLAKARAGAGRVVPRATRSMRCSSGRGTGRGQGRRPHRRPRQERPAARRLPFRS